MSIHIGAAAGEIAPVVLMPGDPYRARWAAGRFLEAPRLVNEVRGMLGFTGTWRGRAVTIQGSGMGMASAAIYATELIRDYGATTLVRIGSAGAMQERLELRDIVLAIAASTLAGPSASRGLLQGMHYAPHADFGLLAAAVAAAARHGVTVHVGGVYSADAFHDGRPDLDDLLARHGVLCVEMETAELYTVAARHGVRALAILTLSDHLLRGEALTPAERETGFGTMIEIALEAALSDGQS